MKNKLWISYGMLLFVVSITLILSGCAAKKHVMKKCDYLYGDYYKCEKP